MDWALDNLIEEALLPCQETNSKSERGNEDHEFYGYDGFEGVTFAQIGKIETWNNIIFGLYHVLW